MRLYHVILRLGVTTMSFERHCVARTPMAAYIHVVEANELDTSEVLGFEVKEIATSVDVDPSS